MVARRGQGRGIGEGDQRVQTSSYKMNKFGDVMYSMVTIVYNNYISESS